MKDQKHTPDEYVLYRAGKVDAALIDVHETFAVLAHALRKCPDISRAVLGDDIGRGLLRYLADVVDARRNGNTPRSLANEVKNAIHASYAEVQPANLYINE
jgi:hypothetical protein